MSDPNQDERADVATYLIGYAAALALTAAAFAAVQVARLRQRDDARHRENGAGEGIRTLDPDLGKVVLYP